MRRILGIAAVVAATVLPSHTLAANSWGTDLSDLWWNPAESGWGANIAHQGDVIFLTLFVYGADNSVKWYVAPAMASQGGANAYAFTGEFYETTGPFLGDALFNPARVERRVVGAASLHFAGVSEGTLSYTVDGVSVTKGIGRQTFRSNDLSGSYIGGSVGTMTACGTSSGAYERSTLFTISHVGANVAISAILSDTLNCAYSGAYKQAGRMGQITGTLTCNTGARGSFNAVEVESGYGSFFTRYSVDYGDGCTESGSMAGVKR